MARFTNFLITTFVYFYFWCCSETVLTQSLYTWMTPYPRSAGLTNWNAMFFDEHSQKCTLKRVEFVARHGTRSPSENQINKTRVIIDKMSKPGVGKTAIGSDIATWSTGQVGGQILLEQGVEEQQFLAIDFHNLMSKFNMTGDLVYSSSSAPRAWDSSKAFSDKFNSLDQAKQFKSEANFVDDDALLFFESCKRYTTQIRGNESSRPLFMDFHQTPLAQQTLKNINTRLFTTPSEFSLTWDEAFSLYYMAGYEVAINGSSKLSYAFSNDDLAVFDYADDLETYWKSVYGYDLNSYSACDLIGKMMESIKSDDTSTAANFRFAHSEVVAPLLAAFSLFKDEKNVYEQPVTSMDTIRNRLFKGSIATPFATNIALLKFNCPGASDDPKMAIVVNGKLMKRPTSFKQFENSMQWAFNCDAESVCDLDSCNGKFEPSLLTCSGTIVFHNLSAYVILLFLFTVLI